MLDQQNHRTGRISFQGCRGAYSHLACADMFPNMEAVPQENFADAIGLVKRGDVDLGMIPIENSSAGRVADIHHLLPESGLFIVGEHYEPVIHHLLAKKGASLESIKSVYSHLHTVGQVRNFVRKHNLKTHVHADNAGAAQWVSQQNDLSIAAIASSLAGELYGLDVLDDNINDTEGNTTRFVVLSREEAVPEFVENRPYVTSLMFETKSVPAALYKALGGFATNGVNITKLESYIIDSSFTAARFYVEVDGHRYEERLKYALAELSFFAEYRLMGTYEASSFRSL